MKKHTLILSLMILPLSVLFAQSDAISTVFTSYANDARFIKVNVSSKMFELFSHIEAGTAEEQEFLNTVKNLTSLKVLTLENDAKSMEFYRLSLKKVTAPYEQLMSIEDGPENITFFINEKNGVINELLMLSGSVDTFVILSLSGKIDLQQVKKLSKQMSIGGMEQLNKVDPKSKGK